MGVSCRTRRVIIERLTVVPDILTGVLGWVTALFTDQTADAAGTPTVPKAYVNYIFSDELFQMAKDATENLLAGYSREETKMKFTPIPT